MYKTVFESYLRLLLSEGYCQEFFIEGGRSRTGKLGQPRMGMLSMLTQAMLDKSAGELYFVPTSITYDKVVEEGSYIDEAAGKKKRREKFTDIFGLTKYLKHRYGKIYVNFGKPISFNQIAANTDKNIDQEDRKTRIVERLAHEIMASLNRGAVVTPASVVATAILMDGSRGITSKELHENVTLLKSYLEFAGIQMSDALTADFDHAVEDVLKKMGNEKTLEIHEDFDPIYYAIPEERRNALDFQKNSVIHFLLPIAYTSLALLVLLKEGKDTFPVGAVNQTIDFLRGFFKTEFAAHSAIVSNAGIDAAVSYLKEKKFIEYDSTTDRISIKTIGADTLKRFKALIDNSLDSYKIAHYTCSRIKPKETVSEKGLLRSMLENGRHLLLLGKISHPEAISQPTFKNAIELFKTLGFLKEEAGSSTSKDGPKYLWNRDNPALAELQQELELFS